MSDVEDKLALMGIDLPSTPPPIANYVPGVQTGNLLYLSGLGPSDRADGTTPSGKLGADMTVEEGYEAARLTGINILARIKGELGDLDRVKRVVKLGGFVNSTPDFTDQPKVVNGASDLMGEVFGDLGKHARFAVGAASLPLGVSVEVDGVFEIG